MRPLDERIGRMLVLAGVAVWPAYGILRWGVGIDIAVHEALPFHLAGVVPGAILARWRMVRRLVLRLWRRGK
ncbi:MAG: hypothetical protein ACK4K2_07465 [Dehalococcoidia bacterium]